MSTATIAPGSKAKVEYEAEYVRDSLVSGSQIFRDMNGGEHTVPSDATVTVVSPPLPPEPGMGTIIKSKRTGAIYQSYGTGYWFAMRECSINRSAVKNKTWAEVVKESGGPESVVELIQNPVTKDTPDVKETIVKLPLTASYGSSNLRVGYNSTQGRIAFSKDYDDWHRISNEDARKLAAILLKATA